MQTFLPLVNLSTGTFVRTARCLDDRRLNKQILEAHQIINILEDRVVRTGYINHPAVTMWRGYTDALKIYFNTMLYEWKMVRQHNHMLHVYTDLKPHDSPPWLSYQHIEILLSHRSALYKKDSVHYNQFADDPYVEPYVWPSDLYETYYRIMYDFEFEVGAPEDVAYFPEHYATRQEAIVVCENNLLRDYGHYFIEGGSRIAIDTPVQLEPLFIRLQPVRFIDYTKPKESTTDEIL